MSYSPTLENRGYPEVVIIDNADLQDWGFQYSIFCADNLINKLPVAFEKYNGTLIIRKIDDSTNTLTIIPAVEHSINGDEAGSVVLYNKYDFVEFMSNGTYDISILSKRVSDTRYSSLDTAVSINSGFSQDVIITWDIPFINTNYRVLSEVTAGDLPVAHSVILSSKTNETVQFRVFNIGDEPIANIKIEASGKYI